MKLFTFVTLATTATLLTATAQAQSSSTSVSSPTGSTLAPGVSTTVIVPPKASTSNIVLGFKSTNTTARMADTDVITSRTSRSKNEAFIGYRFNSGWGGFFNAVNSYSTYYRENTRISSKLKTKPNAWEVGDPSITVLHPDFYKSSQLTVFGQFRYYIPTTDRSVDREINQFAYYFRLNAKFEGGHEIYNELIPRYFGSTKYSPTDTTNYIEDTMIYNYKIDGTGWKIGAKSWAQVEEHKKTGTGYSLEVGPQTTYSFNSNLSISSDISLPLLKSNVVFDGPKAVAMDQAYLTLLLQARL